MQIISYDQIYFVWQSYSSLISSGRLFSWFDFVFEGKSLRLNLCSSVKQSVRQKTQLWKINQYLLFGEWFTSINELKAELAQLKYLCSIHSE